MSVYKPNKRWNLGSELSLGDKKSLIQLTKALCECCQDMTDVPRINDDIECVLFGNLQNILSALSKIQFPHRQPSWTNEVFDTITYIINMNPRWLTSFDFARASSEKQLNLRRKESKLLLFFLLEYLRTKGRCCRKEPQPSNTPVNNQSNNSSSFDGLVTHEVLRGLSQLLHNCGDKVTKYRPEVLSILLTYCDSRSLQIDVESRFSAIDAIGNLFSHDYRTATSTSDGTSTSSSTPGLDMSKGDTGEGSDSDTEDESMPPCLEGLGYIPSGKSGTGLNSNDGLASHPEKNGGMEEGAVTRAEMERFHRRQLRRNVLQSVYANCLSVVLENLRGAVSEAAVSVETTYAGLAYLEGQSARVLISCLRTLALLIPTLHKYHNTPSISSIPVTIAVPKSPKPDFKFNSNLNKNDSGVSSSTSTSKGSNTTSTMHVTDSQTMGSAMDDPISFYYPSIIQTFHVLFQRILPAFSTNVPGNLLVKSSVEAEKSKAPLQPTSKNPNFDSEATLQTSTEESKLKSSSESVVEVESPLPSLPPPPQQQVELRGRQMSSRPSDNSHSSNERGDDANVQRRRDMNPIQKNSLNYHNNNNLNNNNNNTRTNSNKNSSNSNNNNSNSAKSARRQTPSTTRESATGTTKTTTLPDTNRPNKQVDRDGGGDPKQNQRGRPQNTVPSASANTRESPREVTRGVPARVSVPVQSPSRSQSVMSSSTVQGKLWQHALAALSSVASYKPTAFQSYWSTFISDSNVVGEALQRLVATIHTSCFTPTITTASALSVSQFPVFQSPIHKSLLWSQHAGVRATAVVLLRNILHGLPFRGWFRSVERLYSRSRGGKPSVSSVRNPSDVISKILSMVLTQIRTATLLVAIERQNDVFKELLNLGKLLLTEIATQLYQDPNSTSTCPFAKDFENTICTYLALIMKVSLIPGRFLREISVGSVSAGASLNLLETGGFGSDPGSETGRALAALDSGVLAIDWVMDICKNVTPSMVLPRALHACFQPLSYPDNQTNKPNQPDMSFLDEDPRVLIWTKMSDSGHDGDSRQRRLISSGMWTSTVEASSRDRMGKEEDHWRRRANNGEQLGEEETVGENLAQTTTSGKSDTVLLCQSYCETLMVISLNQQIADTPLANMLNTYLNSIRNLLPVIIQAYPVSIESLISPFSPTLHQSSQASEENISQLNSLSSFLEKCRQSQQVTARLLGVRITGVLLSVGADIAAGASKDASNPSSSPSHSSERSTAEKDNNVVDIKPKDEFLRMFIRFINALIAACGDSDHQLRGAAVTGLGNIPASIWRLIRLQELEFGSLRYEIMEVVMKTCRDSVGTVRIAAFKAMSTLVGTTDPGNISTASSTTASTQENIDWNGTIGALFVRSIANHPFYDAVRSSEFTIHADGGSLAPWTSISVDGVHSYWRDYIDEVAEMKDETVLQVMLEASKIGCEDSKLAVRQQAMTAMYSILELFLPLRLLRLHQERLLLFQSDISTNAPSLFPSCVDEHNWIRFCNFACPLLEDSEKMLLVTIRCFGVLVAGLSNHATVHIATLSEMALAVTRAVIQSSQRHIPPTERKTIDIASFDHTRESYLSVAEAEEECAVLTGVFRRVSHRLALAYAQTFSIFMWTLCRCTRAEIAPSSQSPSSSSAHLKNASILLAHRLITFLIAVLRSSRPAVQVQVLKGMLMLTIIASDEALADIGYGDGTAPWALLRILENALILISSADTVQPKTSSPFSATDDDGSPVAPNGWKDTSTQERTSCQIILIRTLLLRLTTSENIMRAENDSLPHSLKEILRHHMSPLADWLEDCWSDRIKKHPMPLSSLSILPTSLQKDNLFQYLSPTIVVASKGTVGGSAASRVTGFTSQSKKGKNTSDLRRTVPLKEYVMEIADQIRALYSSSRLPAEVVNTRSGSGEVEEGAISIGNQLNDSHNSKNQIRDGTRFSDGDSDGFDFDSGQNGNLPKSIILRLPQMLRQGMGSESSTYVNANDANPGKLDIYSHIATIHSLESELRESRAMVPNDQGKVLPYQNVSEEDKDEDEI